MSSRTISNLFTIVGISYFWAVFRNNYLQGLISGTGAILTHVTWFHFAYFGFFIALYVLIGGYALKLEGILRQPSKKLDISGGLVATIGCSMLSLSSFMPATEASLAFCGSVVWTAGFFMLLCRWNNHLCGLPNLSIVQALFASMAFYVSICFAASLVAGGVQRVMAVFFPLLSGICLAAASEDARTQWEAVPGAYPDSKYKKLALCVAGLLLVASTLRGNLLLKSIAQFTNQDYSAFRFISLALAFAGLAALYMQKQHKDVLLTAGFGSVAALGIGTSLILVMPDIFNFVGILFVLTARTFLCLVLWAIVLFVARHAKEAVVKVSATLAGVIALSHLASFVLAPYLVNLTEEAVRLGVGAVLLTLIAVLLLSAYEYLKSDLPVQVVASNAHEVALNHAAAKYNLSEREKDVLDQWSQGRSRKDAGKKLFISPNTVATHVGEIYRKTDCHNRDELIELMHQLETSLVKTA